MDHTAVSATKASLVALYVPLASHARLTRDELLTENNN